MAGTKWLEKPVRWRAANLIADVMILKQLLNLQILFRDLKGMDQLALDGRYDSTTRAVVISFQNLVMNIRPSHTEKGGVVLPAGDTINRIAAVIDTIAPPVESADVRLKWKLKKLVQSGNAAYYELVHASTYCVVRKLLAMPKSDDAYLPKWNADQYIDSDGSQSPQDYALSLFDAVKAQVSRMTSVEETMKVVGEFSEQIEIGMNAASNDKDLRSTKRLVAWFEAKTNDAKSVYSCFHDSWNRGFGFSPGQ